MASNMALINQDKARIIDLIDGRPHCLYIRYLLTKRYSPAYIKKELGKLGLSSPREDTLRKYYIAAIDPLIKQYKLGKLYSNYKSKMVRTNNRAHDFTKDILIFVQDIGDSITLQENFLKFINQLGLQVPWNDEIVRYFGSIENMPTDEQGQPLFHVNPANRGMSEVILSSPKRYLIEKLLLENVSSTRIANFCREKLKIKAKKSDISAYRKVFFNVQRYEIESQLKILLREKKYVQNYLSRVKQATDLPMGEKAAQIHQLTARVHDLDDNLKTLNAMHSDMSGNIKLNETMSYEEIFEDIAKKTYSRFLRLDESHDRDVVDPIVKTIKSLGYAFEKAAQARDFGERGGDQNTTKGILQMYQTRASEQYEQQGQVNEDLDMSGVKRMTPDEEIIPEEIDGVDLLTQISDDEVEPEE